MNKDIKLTQTVRTGGCAAKLDPGMLSDLLNQLDYQDNPNLIMGIKNFSDAGIYKLNDTTALVQTIDFFPPMVDDPFCFGQISVANALSDIYAVGAVPLTALNITCFPDSEMEDSIMMDILKGGLSKLKEAGAVLLGGHTISDDTIKYGIAATGMIQIKDIITNSGARIGDHIVLTKPLGTGIINTAQKKSIDLPGSCFEEALTYMKQLNDKSSQLMKSHQVSACTDITGFSLMGHGIEMAKASDVTLVIHSESIPVMMGVDELLSKGVLCSGSVRNRNFYSNLVLKENSCLMDEGILYDPQTSGGLLICISPDDSGIFLEKLREDGYLQAAIMGEVVKKSSNPLIVR